MKPKPVAKYIKRPEVPTASLQLRIDTKLKAQAKAAAVKMNTSVNRLAEAAIKLYLEMAKKEGSI